MTPQINICGVFVTPQDWDPRPAGLKLTMRCSTAKRDQAIIMTLLDIGLRASELSALKVGDIDLKIGKVQVKHGRLGGA